MSSSPTSSAKQSSTLALIRIPVILMIIAFVCILWSTFQRKDTSDEWTQRVAQSDVTAEPTASSKPIEFNRGFSKAITENDVLYEDSFGRWPQVCDPCTDNCFEKMQSTDDSAHPDVGKWGQQAFSQLTDGMLQAWNSSGITLDHHVSMISCQYRTRTHWNPSGVWVHIYKNNVTSLRQIVDGYQRMKHILKYLKKVVEEGEPFEKPVVAYISVTDTPCNPHIPYLTFFLKRGVKQILIPDDSFHKSVHGGDWEGTRESLLSGAAKVPFESKKDGLFFRGSPTHELRTNMSKVLEECCGSYGNISLAVMEKFKHLAVPLSEHALHRNLLAIRGRTASSRDKYLNCLNSTIVRAEEFEPWFQFYHVLWKPWVNYVPITQAQAKCVVDHLQAPKNEEALRKISARGARIGEWMEQPQVDEYFRKVLRRYGDMQRYKVDPDPVEFLRGFYSFVKKRYKNAQCMPDDRAPLKFMLYKWVSRRIKQMLSCRYGGHYVQNTTQKLAYNSPYKCWYM